MSRKNVVVLGGGIIGLACAYKLTEDKNNKVFIVAKDWTPNTTSDGAGGLWEPYEASPQAKITRWSEITKAELQKLQLKNWPVFTSRSERPVLPNEDYSPYWKHLADNWCWSDKQRRGFKVVTWDSLITISPLYMKKMMEVLQVRGVQFITYTLQSISDLSSPSFPFTTVDLLVNCLGLSSKDIFADSSVYPIRGVIVHLKPQSQLGNFSLGVFGDVCTYVISRPDICILGGTTDKNDWETGLREGEMDRIIGDCTYWIPELEQNGSVKDQVIGYWVGLRPGRKEVRLELDDCEIKKGVKKVPVIHCYGHGGSGWTLHWGCAQDVAEIAKGSLKAHY